MSERFYTNCDLETGLVSISGPEARHLATVCRLRAGDRVILFNGNGKEYHGNVEEVGKRSVMIAIVETLNPERELPFRLEVAAPLPKGDRAQFLVEKLTEIGISAFVPLSTRRTVVHPGDAKLEKLERYVIEASKQCGRNTLMKVEKVRTWDELCQLHNSENLESSGSLKLLAHPRGKCETGLVGNLSGEIRTARSMLVAVGPEGGFTEAEVELAATTGWHLMDMGPRILRMETAAVVMASWIIGLRTLVA